MGLAVVTWLEFVAGVLERGSRRNAGKRCGSRLSDRAPAHPTRPADRTRRRFIGDAGMDQATSKLDSAAASADPNVKVILMPNSPTPTRASFDSSLVVVKGVWNQSPVSSG